MKYSTRFKGLRFLGTGSCFNTEFGNNSAYYFDESKKSLFLIDCGESIFERLCNLESFQKATKIDVLITHMHSDHVGSLPSLIFYCAFVKGIVPTIIYPNKETLISFLNLTGVEDKLYAFCKPEEFTKHSITPVKQKHVANIDAFGYKITIKGKTFYYSGDSASINNDILDALHLGNFSYFYQDVTKFSNGVHMNVNELSKLVPEAVRKRVTCMHFDDVETLKIAKSLGFKIAK